MRRGRHLGRVSFMMDNRPDVSVINLLDILMDFLFSMSVLVRITIRTSIDLRNDGIPMTDIDMMGRIDQRIVMSRIDF